MITYHKLKSIFLGVVLLGSSLASCNLPVKGKTSFTVNNYTDTFDGKCTEISFLSPDENGCSLRDAIYAASQETGTQEIILQGGLYNLNQDVFRSEDDSGIYGDLDITKPDVHIIIIGEGVDITNINGMGRDRVFHVLPGASLELRGMTIYNGNPDFLYPETSGPDCGFFGCGEITNVHPEGFQHVVDEIGGGIIANRGYLRLVDVLITQGTAKNGGGVLNFGSVDMIRANISGNDAERGGGIYNEGSLSFTETMIGDTGLGVHSLGLLRRDPLKNHATSGGGIYNGKNGSIHSQGSHMVNNSASESGGGIYNAGTVEIRDIYAPHNSAVQGGGFVYNDGQLTITGGGENKFSIPALSGGSAFYGGQIYNARFANAHLVHVLVFSSRANFGGAMYNLGILEVEESYFSGNISEENGAVLMNTTDDAKSNLTNVTVERSSGSGGAIHVGNEKGSSIFLKNVTLAFNNMDTLSTNAGSIHIVNSILEENAGVNCSGSVISIGHNIDSGNTCNFNSPGDVSNTSAQLGQIDTANFVYPLLNGSPALDTGDLSNCPTIDQRNLPRPSGIGCDIGAYEEQLFIAGPQADSPTPIPPTVAQVTSVVIPTITLTPKKSVPVTLTFTPPPTNTPTLTPAPDPMNASISGFVWNDANRNSTKDGGETGLAAQTVELGAGACGSSGLASIASNLAGGYSFTGLAAGTYCVSVQRPEKCGDVTSATTPKQVTVILGQGEGSSVSFGFQKMIC